METEVHTKECPIDIIVKDDDKEKKIEDIIQYLSKIRKKIKDDRYLRLEISYIRKAFNISEDIDNDIIEKRLDNILNKKGIKVRIYRNEDILFENIDGSEIPKSTMIDIYIKKKIGEDEVPEVIKSVHYSDMTKSSKFCPENSITLKSNESLYISIREDPKCPIKGVIDRDKIVLKVKVKCGSKYPTITEGKNKIVELFDYYPSNHPSKQDMDSDNIVIEIANIYTDDIVFKGKDKIVKDGSTPYEFWIYLETSSHINRDKYKSRYFKRHSPIIPEKDMIKKKKIWGK